MKAAFGGLLLAVAVAAAPAKADPGPDPAPARSSATIGSSRFHPAQIWGGIGFYDVEGNGEFGINGGGSYAFPVNPDLSALAFANIALAFGSVNTYPITLGGGIRGEHLGPVQLSGLLGLSIVPISNNVGTKVGLGIGSQVNYPMPQVARGFGIQGAFMVHILSDSITEWTINGGVAYTLPY
ncbi:MAG TPA: hypothetical protein VE964_11555 [Myxococcales bacterium]|nr:hypothetical protein [Myxococcales bacterium]